MSLFCESRVFPTPGCAYVVRKAMTWRGGREFAAGEAFDHTALGLSDLEAQQLWSAAEIDVAPPQPARAAPVAKHQQRR
jgi:hypothetical protein